MVGRALWSVRVLLGEDLPDAGSEAVRRTRRGREDVETVESSEASLVSCNQAIEAQAHESVIYEDVIGNLRKSPRPETVSSHLR